VRNLDAEEVARAQEAAAAGKKQAKLEYQARTHPPTPPNCNDHCAARFQLIPPLPPLHLQVKHLIRSLEAEEAKNA
jgi:hypothetical protein